MLGFVIEILLKGRLLNHPAFVNKEDKRHADVLAAVQSHHDLTKMCGLLDDWQGLYAAVRARGQRDGIDYDRMLKTLTAEWTIFARYALVSSDLASARAMRDDVKHLKEILK